MWGLSRVPLFFFRWDFQYEDIFDLRRLFELDSPEPQLPRRHEPVNAEVQPIRPRAFLQWLWFVTPTPFFYYYRF